MVIAYHLIWTAYGYWLPNDPRGSMSKTIACDVIAELGALHFGRKKVQPSAREVKQFRDQARNALKHPLLDFKLSDFATIADSLAEAIRQHMEKVGHPALRMPDMASLWTEQGAGG